jgi:hypothetical protein
MRFEIRPPILGAGTAVWDEPAAFEDLNHLIVRADEAEHEVDLHDADLLDASAWFADARPRERTRLLDLQLRSQAAVWQPRSAPVARPTYTVTSVDAAARALRIARTSLRVLVENELRDGALIDAAVRLLASDPLRRLWLRPPVPPVFEVRNAGGAGEVPGLLMAWRQAAVEAELPLRVVVFVDSDRNAPEVAASGKAQRAESAATSVGATCLVASKRSAENYLPDEHWAAERARDPRNPAYKQGIDELLEMTTDDRDFVDMGEAKKGRKQVAAQYDAERPYHLTVFRDRVVASENDSTARETMADDLRKRDHAGDLSTLLDHLEKDR